MAKNNTISIGGEKFDARVRETEYAIHIYYPAKMEDKGPRKGLITALESIAKPTEKDIYYHATG